MASAIPICRCSTTNGASPAELKKLAGTLNFILVTANASLDWDAIIGALAPRGRLHFVGAVLAPVPVAAFSLIGGRLSWWRTPGVA